jgi:hypothetical protein
VKVVLGRAGGRDGEGWILCSAYLVALAREAGADTIVSGDKDLLDHAGLEPPALSAREACELVGLI